MSAVRRSGLDHGAGDWLASVECCATHVRTPQVQAGAALAVAVTVLGIMTTACTRSEPSTRFAVTPTAGAPTDMSIAPGRVGDVPPNPALPPTSASTVMPSRTATLTPVPVTGCAKGHERTPVRAGTAPWPAWDVEVAGRYAYVAGYDRSLRIVDLADPAHPREVAAWTAWPAGAELSLPGGDVALDGRVVYVSLPGEVWVVDVTDPTSPRTRDYLLGTTWDTTWRITATSGRLYDFGFDHVGVSAEPNPETSGGTRADPSRGTPPEVRGQVGTVRLGDEIVDLAPGDGLLVACLGTRGLQVLDLTEPDHPRPAGRFRGDWAAGRARVADGVAFVVESVDSWTPMSRGALHLVDVREADAPREVGSWAPDAIAEDARARVVACDAADGRAVALIDEGGTGFRLALLDVSDPSRPREIARQTGDGRPRLEDEPEVRMTGDVAVIAGGYAGLRVVDLSGPAVREVGVIDPPDGAFDVAVDGGVAYVPGWSDGLRIIDVRDPDATRELGSFAPAGCVVDAALAGGHAFVAASEDGLRVLDVRDPARPHEVGAFELADWDSGETVQAGLATGVDVAGDHAYVTSNRVALTVLDVRDPARPRPVGEWVGDGRAASDVDVVGLVAYVNGWSRLDLVDVRDPSAPRSLGGVDVPADPSRSEWEWTGIQDVAIDGDTAYVAVGDDGVLVVDVRDPTRPTVRERLEAPQCTMRSGGSVLGVAVSDGSLWLAPNGHCVLEYRVPDTEPSSERTGRWCDATHADAPGMARRIRVVGDRVYVAASYGGLWVLPRP